MSTSASITIVIADDHPLFRHGLSELLSNDPRFRVTGEAGDGESALEMIVRLKPAVAILDVEMPKMSGLEVARRLHTDAPDTLVIIITMYEEYSIFNQAMEAGVMGYILKDTALPDILNGISRVVEGRYYISPALTASTVQHSHQSSAALEQRLHLDRLSPTERQVLRQVAESKTSREIAVTLTLSVRTVDNHRYNICRKLQLDGTYSLLRFALENRDGI